MRRWNVALLYAVVHQSIDLVGFVEDRIHAQLRAAHPDIWRGVVAEHHNTLVGLALAACGQHAQTAALAQKKINDGKIPLGRVQNQPRLAIVFGFSDSHRLDKRKLFKSSNEVLANGGVVFNNIGFKFHYRIRCTGYTKA